MLYNLKYRVLSSFKTAKDIFLRTFYFSRVSTPFDNVLIVKTDAIGDYIITRNFFYEVKKNPKFRTSKFYLVCSPRVKDLANELDGEFFEMIFVTGAELKDPEKRLDFFKSLNVYKFRYLLHPTYSPDQLAHSFVKYSRARYKIGFKGDSSNCSIEDKKHFEKFYTWLIEPGDKFGHEFLRQKNFFANVVQHSISLDKPLIKLHEINGRRLDILLCPGAQHVQRIWAVENYVRLLSSLRRANGHLSFGILTGPGEDSLNDSISSILPFNAIIIKSPSFKEMLQSLNSAELVICNDSAPAHMAVALGKKSVCISNGNHFGRFVPYPQNCDARQITVVPPGVKDAGIKGGVNPFYFGSDLNINTIIFDDVLNACLTQLNND